MFAKFCLCFFHCHYGYQWIQQITWSLDRDQDKICPQNIQLTVRRQVEQLHEFFAAHGVCSVFTENRVRGVRQQPSQDLLIHLSDQRMSRI